METGIAKSTQAVSVSGELVDIQRLEQFTERMNEKPAEDRLKKTPDGKAKYIPIEIIEMELRQDFAGLVQFIIKSERRELNEMVVVACIRVFHPVILQWMDYDGIGAVVIMQDANTPLTQFADKKKPNALMLNAPKAYAEAIKNAAKKIGKKYGADINRKAEEEYESIYTNEAMSGVLHEEISKLFKEKESKLSDEEKTAIQRVINNYEENSYNKVLTHLQSK